MIDYDTEHDWQWPKDKEVRWVMPMKGSLAVDFLLDSKGFDGWAFHDSDGGYMSELYIYHYILLSV